MEWNDHLREQVQRLSLAPSIAYLPDEKTSNDPVAVKTERDEALAEIEKDIASLSPVPSEITSKIAALGSAETVVEIRALKGEILRNIAQEIENRKNDNSLNALTSRDEQTQKLWSDFGTCEKEIEDEFAELAKHHKITPEQAEYMHDERARLNALPENSDERITDETKFAAYQKELGINVRDQARKDGDHETEQAADKTVHQVDEQTKRLDGLHKLYAEEKKNQIQPEKAKASMHMSDDDEPATTINTSKINHGMEVANATLNEIQAPAGGKDRSVSRTTIKT